MLVSWYLMAGRVAHRGMEMGTIVRYALYQYLIPAPRPRGLSQYRVHCTLYTYVLYWGYQNS